MSLMKQRNNKGARTVPCGTPDDTVAKSLWPSTTTCCSYSIRNKAFIQINKSPRILYHNGVTYEIGAGGTLYYEFTMKNSMNFQVHQ